MAANTKSRATPARQPALLRTPEPKSRMKAHLAPGSVARGQRSLTMEEKQGIIEALDLEIAERTQRFHDALEYTLQSFMKRQPFEMMRIPEAVRGMKLRDLQKGWDGNLMRTVEKMKRDVKEREAAEQRERQEAERREMEGAKRKRAEEAGKEDAAARGKTPRKGKTPALTPLGKLAAPRPGTGTKGKQPLFSNPNSRPSDHVFAPNFASDTPIRQLKRTDILYTANGSPIYNPYAASQPNRNLSVSPIATTKGRGPNSPLRQAHGRLPSGQAGGGEEEEEEGGATERSNAMSKPHARQDTLEEEDESEAQDDVDEDADGEGDLPDVAELERQLEAQALGEAYSQPSGSSRIYPRIESSNSASASATGQLSSTSSSSSRLKRQSTSNALGTYTTSTLPVGTGKMRRPSSLLIRKSILPDTGAGGGAPRHDSQTDSGTQLPLHFRRVVIRDHEIVFDPLNLDRAHLQRELDEGDTRYTDEEKEQVRREVHKCVAQAMKEMQDMWAV